VKYEVIFKEIGIIDFVYETIEAEMNIEEILQKEKHLLNKFKEELQIVKKIHDGISLVENYVEMYCEGNERNFEILNNAIDYVIENRQLNNTMYTVIFNKLFDIYHYNMELGMKHPPSEFEEKIIYSIKKYTDNDLKKAVYMLNNGRFDIKGHSIWIHDDFYTDILVDFVLQDNYVEMIKDYDLHITDDLIIKCFDIVDVDKLETLLLFGHKNIGGRTSLVIHKKYPKSFPFEYFTVIEKLEMLSIAIANVDENYQIILDLLEILEDYKSRLEDTDNYRNLIDNLILFNHQEKSDKLNIVLKRIIEFEKQNVVIYMISSTFGHLDDMMIDTYNILLEQINKITIEKEHTYIARSLMKKDKLILLKMFIEDCRNKYGIDIFEHGWTYDYVKDYLIYKLDVFEKLLDMIPIRINFEYFYILFYYSYTKKYDVYFICKKLLNYDPILDIVELDTTRNREKIGNIIHELVRVFVKHNDYLSIEFLRKYLFEQMNIIVNDKQTDKNIIVWFNNQIDKLIENTDN
jgi:hypothetical protein